MIPIEQYLFFAVSLYAFFHLSISIATTLIRPSEGYPVFTVRTAAVNALGIPTVFFLGAILAMQFKSY